MKQVKKYAVEWSIVLPDGRKAKGTHTRCEAMSTAQHMAKQFNQKYLDKYGQAIVKHKAVAVHSNYGEEV